MEFLRILQRAGGFVQIRFGVCSPCPRGGEEDPAGCENGKQLKALTIKSSSVSGEEVVRAPLLLQVGITRTVLFPASGSLELLSAHYSFTAVVFSLVHTLSVAVKWMENVGGSVCGNRSSCCAELSWSWDQFWDWSAAQTSQGGDQVGIAPCGTTKPSGATTKLLRLLISRILG